MIQIISAAACAVRTACGAWEMAAIDDIVSKLDQLQAEIEKKPGAIASWLAPALIAGLVALLVGAIINFLLGPKDHLEHIRGISATKGRIITACYSNRETSAIIYMTHELLPLY